MASKTGNHKIIPKIVVLFSIVGLLFSILVYLQHRGNDVVNGVCHAINVLNQCDIVGTSHYASVLGIDNSIIGMVGFSIMVYLSIYQLFRPSKLYKSLIVSGSFIAGLLAIMFLLIQMFILDAFCIYCVVVDIASISLLFIALIGFRKNQR